MDPQAPSQPSQQTGYNQPNNPADQTASESSVAATSASNTTPASQQPIDHRQPHDVPSTHSHDATPSSLGYGSTGPLEETPIPASDAQNYSKSELDGEQMRAPGEGDVADAVTEKKFGGHGEQTSLTEDIDGKARRHREALHEMGMKTGAEIEEDGAAANRAGDDGSGVRRSVGEEGGGGVVAGDVTTTTRKTADGGEVDLGEAVGGRGGVVVLAPDQ